MGAQLKSIAQSSDVSHIAIGDIVVSVINDGVHPASFDDLVTSNRAACETAHLGEFRLSPPWLTINCFVIRSGDRLLLVDAGFAGKTEHVGRLLGNLNAMGVAPADIDSIVMTHMHPDHEAGLIDSSRKAVFPKAELVLHENELAFWKDDGAMARATTQGRGDFHIARAALAAYADRVFERSRRTKSLQASALSPRRATLRATRRGSLSLAAISFSSGATSSTFQECSSPSPTRASPTTSIRLPLQRGERRCSNSLPERSCASPASTSTPLRSGTSSRTARPIATCRKSGGRPPDRSSAARDEVRLLCCDGACAEDFALPPARLPRSSGARPAPFLTSHIR
jgi:Metallo-beta-lactamase superfamily